MENREIIKSEIKAVMYKFMGVFIKAKGNPYEMAEIQSVYDPLIDQLAELSTSNIERECNGLLQSASEDT